LEVAPAEVDREAIEPLQITGEIGVERALHTRGGVAARARRAGREAPLELPGEGRKGLVQRERAEPAVAQGHLHPAQRRSMRSDFERDHAILLLRARETDTALGAVHRCSAA
jgi:hypothetical protein